MVGIDYAMRAPAFLFFSKRTSILFYPPNLSLPKRAQLLSSCSETHRTASTTTLLVVDRCTQQAQTRSTQRIYTDYRPPNPPAHAWVFLYYVRDYYIILCENTLIFTVVLASDFEGTNPVSVERPPPPQHNSDRSDMQALHGNRRPAHRTTYHAFHLNLLLL